MIFKLVRKTFGCLFTLLFFCLLLISGVIWAMLHFLPTLVEDQVEDRTGFKANFDNLKVKPFSSQLDLTDAHLENPSTFPKPDFIEINQFKLVLSPSSLWRSSTVVEEIIVDIEKFGYIIAEDKRNNAVTFIKSLRSGLSPEKEAPEEEASPSERTPRKYLIKHLIVRLGTVEVADFSAHPPKVREYQTDIELELYDVADSKDVVRPLSEALIDDGLTAVVNNVLQSMFDFEAYRDLVGSLLKMPTDTLKSGAETAIDGAENTGKALKKVFETLKKN